MVHWWTSGGESKAISVFAEEFKKRGGTWIDSAVVGGQAARASAMNRIAGGDPPSAAQWNAGVAVRKLAEEGLLTELDDLAAAGGWEKVLPPLIVKNNTYDGHVVAVPTDIHGNNWMWYSTKIFQEVGAEPPKTWDEFFAVADKIKAKGYIPFGLGGEPWQEGLLFGAILAGTAGKDTYRKIYVDHDAELAGGPGTVKAFETLRRLKDYVDEGHAGRKWNDTTMMVASNKAAMQIMGDWAKGEFASAGLTPGKEFGCVLAPGTQDAYILTVDVFVFPKQTDEAKIKAQRQLAEVMMDPAVQVRFNQFKGALPARLDADVGTLDPCAQAGQKVLADVNNQIPNTALGFNNDVEGQINDLVTQFWTTPEMSAADAAKQFADIVANADI
ncbi:ABC transporter substrate-binding protein [Inquilinus sp. Marseille-Q2685]|uniref:ABC transporter substrate-binding protein n=1 Tax=Inquilinus sp. Marseille-Q2685 TaxID=2866581 RepID=UPI001CE3EB91|nr:ABC transporter substrate-binding protein [Inquilinus sp. Marseille-Q2685]